MMKYLVAASAFFIAASVNAQDKTTLLKQADNLEKQFKDNDALNIYKQVFNLDAGDMNILVKCTELNAYIGERTIDKSLKINYYNAAKSFADKALALDSNNALSNYAEALAYGKLIETDEENKQIVYDARQIYFYAGRSLSIDPNNAKTNYIMGKWHYATISLPWYKKVAVKAIYGKMPQSNIDSATWYMEKCRSLDIYFLQNYLDLAKAYEYDNNASKEIEILQKLIHMPNRATDDAAVKAQGQTMLNKLQ